MLRVDLIKNVKCVHIIYGFLGSSLTVNQILKPFFCNEGTKWIHLEQLLHFYRDRNRSNEQILDSLEQKVDFDREWNEINEINLRYFALHSSGIMLGDSRLVNIRILALENSSMQFSSTTTAHILLPNKIDGKWRSHAPAKIQQRPEGCKAAEKEDMYF